MHVFVLVVASYAESNLIMFSRFLTQSGWRFNKNVKCNYMHSAISSNDTSCLSATLDFSLGRTQTSLYSKTSVFVRPHENDQLVFSTNSSLGTVFENLKTPFTCGRKAKTEGKKSLDTCGRVLKAY